MACPDAAFCPVRDTKNRPMPHSTDIVSGVHVVLQPAWLLHSLPRWCCWGRLARATSQPVTLVSSLVALQLVPQHTASHCQSLPLVAAAT